VAFRISSLLITLDERAKVVELQAILDRDVSYLLEGLLRVIQVVEGQVKHGLEDVLPLAILLPLQQIYLLSLLLDDFVQVLL